MKKNIYNVLWAVALVLSLAGCGEYDNFDEPSAVLEGNVVYDGDPVGLRTNGPQLELWQDGYELEKEIDVYIAHDGHYSVSLFDGRYKMVVKEGGPWVPALSDTLVVEVKGKTVFDVPVTPYYIVRDEEFQVSGNSVTARFTVDKIAETASLAEVKVYFGTSVLTDANRNEYEQSVPIADIGEGEQTGIDIGLPEIFDGEEYLFVRVGVRAAQTNEFYYTQVRKIEL